MPLAPAPVRVRLRYLLEPPGWSPDGSTLTAPQMRAARDEGLERDAGEAALGADAAEAGV